MRLLRGQGQRAGRAATGPAKCTGVPNRHERRRRCRHSLDTCTRHLHPRATCQPFRAPELNRGDDEGHNPRHKADPDLPAHFHGARSEGGSRSCSSTGGSGSRICLLRDSSGSRGGYIRLCSCMSCSRRQRGCHSGSSQQSSTERDVVAAAAAAVMTAGHGCSDQSHPAAGRCATPEGISVLWGSGAGRATGGRVGKAGGHQCHGQSTAQQPGK